MAKKSVIIIGLVLILLTTMSFLNKIFNIKNTTDLSENSSHVREDWSSYFSNVNGKLGSIFVNLALKNVAPIKNQPNEVWISVIMNTPRPDGLSSSDESKILIGLEESLVKAIKTKHTATDVGGITSDGYRDLFFYFADTDSYDKTIGEAMLEYPDYKYTYGTKIDKEWNDYLTLLYPNPKQYQSIQNGKVVLSLQKNGDILIKERPVDHWIYFRSQKDSLLFIEEVKKQGFTITKETQMDKLKDFPYQVKITRSDKVDQNSVDSYVLPLWRLAQENNGD